MRAVARLSPSCRSSCSGAVAAEGNNLHCDIDSDYDLTLNERSLILTRASGVAEGDRDAPGTPVRRRRMGHAQRRRQPRIADFEKGMRATMPLAQAIGRDAADIAFTALGEVAAGFSSDPKDTQAQLAAARSQLDARLARSVTANRFDGERSGEGIGEACPRTSSRA